MDGSASARPLPAVTLVCRSLGFLALEAASVGLAGWTLRAGQRLPGYVAGNALPKAARNFVFINMGVAMLAVLLVAGVFLLWKRGLAVELVHRVSHRCAPLALAAFVPLLLRWDLWPGRELSFLVLAAIFTLSLQGLMRVSLDMPPVFLGWRAPAPVRAVKSGFAALARVRFLPLALVLLGATWYAVFFSFHTIVNHHNFGTAAFDLGIENNLVWNAIHWGPLFKTSPLFGPDSTHLGFHQTYFSYVIGIFYRLSPRCETLLIFQAMLLGFSAVPLYFVAKKHLGEWLACLVAVLYVLYPPLHGANLYDFHYLPFAPFFLWLTLYFLQERRDGWAVVAVIFTLSVREDISSLLAVLGLFLVLTGQRPKAGLVVTAVGGAYFVILKMIIMPRFLGGHSSYVHQYQGLVPEGENSFGGVLKTAIGNPGFTMTSLLERDKLVYLLQIIGPLAFLPWRRPVGLLCSLPGFFFTLLSTQYPPLIQISFQYTAYWTPFLFLAVIANLTWMKPAYHTLARVRGLSTPNPTAWVVALVAAMVVHSNQFGALLQQNTVRGGFGPYHFGSSQYEKDRYKIIYGLIAKIPPMAKVASTEMIVPHLSSRPDAYTLRTGYYDAEYILFPITPRGEEAKFIVEALKSGKYGVLADTGEFVLVKLGMPTDKNADVLKRLGY
jgi:uncharacterized membrane protein